MPASVSNLRRALVAVVTVVAVGCSGSGSEPTLAPVADPTAADAAAPTPTSAEPTVADPTPAEAEPTEPAEPPAPVRWRATLPLPTTLDPNFTESAPQIVQVRDGEALIGFAAAAPESVIGVVDTTDGTLRWSAVVNRLPGDDVEAALLADVVVHSQVEGATTALIGRDAETGEQRWRRNDGGEVWSPVGDDRIVASRVDSADGLRTLVLDASSGDEVWRSPLERLEGWLVDPPLVLRERDLDGNVVLTRVDIETGEVVWRAQDIAFGARLPPLTEVGLPERDSPVVAIGDGGIVALDADDGSRLWAAPLPDDAAAVFGVWDLELVLVCRPDGAGGVSMVALDHRSGDERWRLDPAPGGLVAATAGALVFATDDPGACGASGIGSGVAVVDGGGSVLWTQSESGAAWRFDDVTAPWFDRAHGAGPAAPLLWEAATDDATTATVVEVFTGEPMVSVETRDDVDVRLYGGELRLAGPGGVLSAPPEEADRSFDLGGVPHHAALDGDLLLLGVTGGEVVAIGCC